VHYEILLNGRIVDPMRIKLPRGRALEGALMAGFEEECDRLDAMMNNRGAGSRVSDAGGARPPPRKRAWSATAEAPVRGASTGGTACPDHCSRESG
jgi:hypothetical protein